MTGGVGSLSCSPGFKRMGRLVGSIVSYRCSHFYSCSHCVLLSQFASFCPLQEVCHRYWPDGDVQEFGEMEVESLSMKQCDGYTTRILTVTKVVQILLIIIVNTVL